MQAFKNVASGFISTANDALQAALAAFKSVMSSEHAQSLNKEIFVKQILIHPIKSCKGISVEKAEYDVAGLKYDRTWLIIDAETRRFYTARDLPKMVLIHTVIEKETNKLIIDIPPSESGLPESTVITPLDPSDEQFQSYPLIEDITIWVHKVNGYAVSKEADEKLSAYFGKQVRLVRKGPSPRPSGPSDIDGPKEWDEATVRYQDFYPCLVASVASLHNVQQTLLASVYPSLPTEQEQVQAYRVPKSDNRDYWTPEELESLPITRFRPNILVGTVAGTDRGALTAWEEDGWMAAEFFPPPSSSDSQDRPPFGIEAEGKGLYLVEKCARCMVPNIDPQTGIRDNFLPYRVLQEYRKVTSSTKPCFGMKRLESFTSEIL